MGYDLSYSCSSIPNNKESAGSEKYAINYSFICLNSVSFLTHVSSAVYTFLMILFSIKPLFSVVHIAAGNEVQTNRNQLLVWHLDFKNLEKIDGTRKTAIA